MSLNLSRADKSEAQPRNPGRSGNSAQQRGLFGGGGKGAAGGSAPPPPPRSSSSSNRSFRKSGNGLGGYSSANPGGAGSEAFVPTSAAGSRDAQNGSHMQASSHGAPNFVAPGGAKPMESSASRNHRGPPRPPSSSNSATPATPTKGVTSKAFTLQFGSINAGFANGMPVPARTSSAPPNLDEQKRDQVCCNSFQAIPTLPITSAPKEQHHQSRKNVLSGNHCNVEDYHFPSLAKRDVPVQVSASPSVATQNISVPTPEISMPMGFQQMQIPIQFGGPGLLLQSQGITGSSQQIPLSLSMENAQAQQHFFVPNIPSHILPQAMHHGLGFTPQIGHQLASQVRNLGMGLPPQYIQLQAGNVATVRKTPVRITHPDTHEELRLDKMTESHLDAGSLGQKPSPGVPSQIQPISSYTPNQQMNYYQSLQPGSFNPGGFFLQTPTSLPLPLISTPVTSGLQDARYNSQISQNGVAVSFMKSPVLNHIVTSEVSSQLHGKSQPVNLGHHHNHHDVSISAPPAPLNVTVKPAVISTVDKLAEPPITVEFPSKEKALNILNPPREGSLSHQQRRDQKSTLESSTRPPKSVLESCGNILSPVKDTHHPSVTSTCSPNMPPSAPDSVEDSASAVSSTDSSREGVFKSSNSSDQQKKPSRKDIQLPQHQDQAYASESAVGRELLFLGKESHPLDHNIIHESRNSEEVHAISGLAEVPSFIPTLPCPIVEHGNSPGVHLSTNDDDKTSPGSLESSGIALREALQEISPRICSLTETAPDDHSEIGLLETSTSCDPKFISPSICSSSETAPDDVPPTEIGPLEISHSDDTMANGITLKRVVVNVCPKQDNSLTEFEMKQNNVVVKEHVKTEVSAESTQVISGSPDSFAFGSLASVEQAEFARNAATDDNLGEEPIENEQIVIESETTGCSSDANKVVGSERNVSRPGCMEDSFVELSKSKPAGTDGKSLSNFLLHNSHVDEASLLNALKDNTVTIGGQEDSLADKGVLPLKADSSLCVDNLEVTQKYEKITDALTGGSGSAAVAEMKERTSTEAIKGKKKKIKHVLSRADAAGTNSDLYMAYKGPEEKHETIATQECVEKFSVDTKEVPTCDPGKDAIVGEGKGQNKLEPDDWEVAADISTPKLRMLENGLPTYVKKKVDDEYGNGATTKKYSRDFLLTFREQCTDLPVGFLIGSDIRDALMSIQVSTPRISDWKPFPSPGRIIDRPIGAAPDHRPSGLDDKWNKASTSFGTGHDIRADANFRPGQGVGMGVLRDHRVQSSSYDGGILSGPMQSVLSLGRISRRNADADRWQHGTGIQRGLISPQTPLQVMHKAERKYEVGKVSDKEEAKQRQLKAILNKLTPQNFDRLFEQVKEVNIDNAVALTGVISQIFDKALMEPTFCEMYANFCFHLAGVLPDFSEGDEKITFRRLLLNKCQEEFERGEREQDEANRAEGGINQSEGEREEKKIKARRRMLGNIRLIGELYKKRMLTERIMHECIQTLLGESHNPDEEDIEALCKLMSTIGEMIDHSRAKEHMDAYFDMMTELSTNQKLSSRVRFMLRDAIDLRRNRWQQRRKVEGPKKIEEVHRDAAQERHAHASRLGRGPTIGSARRGPPPVDYGSRGSTLLPSPISQPIGASSSFPSQGRAFGNQDVRSEDRHPFESRPLSLPLSRRPIDDSPITLGPQGGLGRGMSIRGQPLLPTVPLAEATSRSGGTERMVSGPNSCSSLLDQTSSSLKDELVPRYVQERDSGSLQEPSKTSSLKVELIPRYVQERDSGSLQEPSKTSPPDHKLYFSGRELSNTDRAFDRISVSTTLSSCEPVSFIGSPNVLSETKQLSEVYLQDKSISAIREFYSAKDEKEIALCIRELNSPSFYPSMVSLWVMDSFERKDIDRESLAKLLVSLSGPQESLLSQEQLIQGFESVLFSLEDTVNDAPRAAEFLGCIFAKVVLENVLSLNEIGRLIREGGEEPGRLLEIGLASEVLGSILEKIRTEQGDATLNEIRSSSNLELEDFRSPHPIKSKKLEAFL